MRPLNFTVRRHVDKHLIAAGCFVASLICFWFAIAGIRSGVVSAPQGRHTTPVDRDQDPLRFWVAVSLYLGVGAVLTYWGLRSAV